MRYVYFVNWFLQTLLHVKTYKGLLVFIKGQEEWVFNLISARTDLEHKFKSFKDPRGGWR